MARKKLRLLINNHVREGVILELDSPTKVKPSDDESGHQLDYSFMGDIEAGLLNS